MKKQYILPSISMIFIIALVIFLIVPNARNIVTGLIIGNQESQISYRLEGQIKITTPVEIYENCIIALELEDENTREIQEQEVSAKEFEEKSILSKEGEFFIYTSELSDLTENFVLVKGNYFITIKVFCGEDLISQTQEYFTI